MEGRMAGRNPGRTTNRERLQRQRHAPLDQLRDKPYYHVALLGRRKYEKSEIRIEWRDDNPKGADKQGPMEPKLCMGHCRPMSKNSPNNQYQQQKRVQVLEHPDNRKSLVKALGFRANRRVMEDSFKIVPDGVGCDEQAQQANGASGQTRAGRTFANIGRRRCGIISCRSTEAMLSRRPSMRQVTQLCRVLWGKQGEAVRAGRRTATACRATTRPHRQDLGDRPRAKCKAPARPPTPCRRGRGRRRLATCRL